LIEAVSSMQGIHLFIIGRGTALGEMKELTEKLKLRSMITFLPVMPWEEMMRITSMADVGMSLDSGDSLNYYYSLPNKIFDYLNAGVAIIATDLPEISAIIKENNCGLVIPGNEPALIAEAIIQLETNRDLLKQFKDNSRKASAKYSWDNETELIKDLYVKAGVDIS